MSESKDKSAFPKHSTKTVMSAEGNYFNTLPCSEGGMTAQEYAAIHLKVPMSGTPWLDEMIQKARRDEFAKAAMNGIISNHQLMYNIDMASKKHTVDTALIVSETALSLADALIKAADEGIGEK